MEAFGKLEQLEGRAAQSWAALGQARCCASSGNKCRGGNVEGLEDSADAMGPPEHAKGRSGGASIGGAAVFAAQPDGQVSIRSLW